MRLFAETTLVHIASFSCTLDRFISIAQWQHLHLELLHPFQCPRRGWQSVNREVRYLLLGVCSAGSIAISCSCSGRRTDLANSLPQGNMAARTDNWGIATPGGRTELQKLRKTMDSSCWSLCYQCCWSLCGQVKSELEIEKQWLTKSSNNGSTVHGCDHCRRPGLYNQ